MAVTNFNIETPRTVTFEVVTDLRYIKGDKGDKGDTGATGPQGPKGTDGITPTIGANGNWFLGSTDTGKPSRGATGAKGDPGTDYVLTSADKAEIAALVLAEIPNGDEVTYG